jgi:hypothetical protein
MRLGAVFFLFLFTPLFVGAQFSGVDYLETGTDIEVQPTYPQPEETVQFTLNDYEGGYYGATLEWFKNGTLIPNTQSKRTITLTAPKAGESDTISLVLKTPTGKTRVLRKVISPLYADIIVEPQTHVPNFYKGRALPSAGSTINLTALLSDTGFRDTDLVYRWEVGDEVIEGGALRGRNQISFVAPQDSEIFVSLQISTPAGETLADRAIFIQSVRPMLAFYEINALYGVEPRAIGKDFTMISDSTVIVAEPYYLDSNVFNYPNVLEWKINRDTVESTSGNPYELLLEKTGDSGTATINFQVQSTTDFLQGARSSFEITL